MFDTIDKKLVFPLFCFHVFIIALSNYIVQYTFDMWGFHFTYAMFTFPLVILATDLTVRISNPLTARVIVGLAFIPAVIISIWLSDIRIGLASVSAYMVGQFLDITVFQKIRERIEAWWVAPLISTVAANTIETYTFFGTAFYNSADPHLAANWVEIATTDLIFKILFGTFIMLPMYGVLLKNILKRINKNEI